MCSMMLQRNAVISIQTSIVYATAGLLFHNTIASCTLRLALNFNRSGWRGFSPSCVVGTGLTEAWLTLIAVYTQRTRLKLAAVCQSVLQCSATLPGELPPAQLGQAPRPHGRGTAASAGRCSGSGGCTAPCSCRARCQVSWRAAHASLHFIGTSWQVVLQPRPHTCASRMEGAQMCRVPSVQGAQGRDRQDAGAQGAAAQVAAAGRGGRHPGAHHQQVQPDRAPGRAGAALWQCCPAAACRQHGTDRTLVVRGRMRQHCVEPHVAACAC